MNTSRNVWRYLCPRVLAPLFLLAALFATAPQPDTVRADDGLHACDYRPTYGEVPCQEVDRAIAGSALEFRLDEAKLRRIVRCESTFNPHANSGEYRGLFQQAADYWGERVADFNDHHDPDVGPNIYSPFDNARVSARMLAGGLDEHWPNCA